jgi:predicted enzyme related to lactoylglutathione lyase
MNQILNESKNEIQAKEPRLAAGFYGELLDMQVSEVNDDLVVLKNSSGESVYYIRKPSLDVAADVMADQIPNAIKPKSEMDVPVADLEIALQSLERLGGKVRERWEHPEMIGARCEDPDGNSLLVWQSKIQ